MTVQGPSMRQLRLDFWARLVAILAGLLLALGLVLWTSGFPPTRGMRWVFGPASMECWALAVLLRDKHRLLENLLLAQSAVWLVAGFILLLR